MIEDKIGEVSSEGFWNERQLENAVQTAVMWDSLFCVTRLPPTVGEGHGPNRVKYVIDISSAGSFEDKIGEVSSEGFWNERQLENAAQTEVM